MSGSASSREVLYIMGCLVLGLYTGGQNCVGFIIVSFNFFIECECTQFGDLVQFLTFS